MHKKRGSTNENMKAWGMKYFDMRDIVEIKILRKFIYLHKISSISDVHFLKKQKRND